MKNARIKRFVWMFHFGWIIAMLALVIAGGVQHDYVFYLDQWRLAFSLPAQWVSYSYGPIHLILAYATVFGPLGPKILMCAAFAVVDTYLLYRLMNYSGNIKTAILFYLLCIPLNGLIIFAGFWYGQNDILVAGFILAAILARLDRKFVLTGILIGLAALIKYYPLLFLPFLMFDDRSIRLRPAFSAISIFVFGIGLTWLLLGNSIFSSWFVGISKPAKLLSILSSLHVHPWVAGGKGIVEWLVEYNSLMVVCVAILMILLSWYNGLSWLSSFVVGTLAILLSYKVGHQQFYLPWLTAIAGLPLLSNKHDLVTAWICLPFVVFLSVFQTIYTLGTKMLGPWQIVRDHVGFFVLILGISTIYFVVRQHSDLPKRSFNLAW